MCINSDIIHVTFFCCWWRDRLELWQCRHSLADTVCKFVRQRRREDVTGSPWWSKGRMLWRSCGSFICFVACRVLSSLPFLSRLEKTKIFKWNFQMIFQLEIHISIGNWGIIPTYHLWAFLLTGFCFAFIFLHTTATGFIRARIFWRLIFICF